jgi:hypothetical protein
MKLDYLPSGSVDCPLIRLYDFSPVEAKQLHVAVGRLASGELDQVAVHDLPRVASVDRCRLWLCVRSWDQGVVCKSPPADFDCGFTAGTWDNTNGLIETMIRGSDGCQWLAQAPGEVALLMSTSGTW